MQKFVPTAYIKTIEPEKDKVGIDKPTPVIGYDYALIAGKSVPDDVVQRIVKAMQDNPDKVRNIYKAFSQFTHENMMPIFPRMTVHKRVENYYAEAGLME
ncbi:TAXI family TRAP transporter solute-binding subunit [Salinicola sp. LHM]|jgi:hypothetical protein|uniref:TAXI family TRAP transporter solute-binding subunit n=1 Tax=Salinicola sp. LHM TaxID=3065298 RepID=UPI002ACDBFD3|nr:TAXI family TRAP transporter solute-binding subunit [Salinicola sp. LHM]MED5501765.1 TAXI family TRAP transporter solute-binding subunit [Pseudomonadota bacterium]WQH32586.1 TAXI family TRAP transporter solute-binding subunit [Salinicola sp. LHM]